MLVRARARLAASPGEGPRLGPEVFERVRAVAPGFDPYWLEAEWRRLWQSSGRPEIRSPEAAFLAFARVRAGGGRGSATGASALGCRRPFGVRASGAGGFAGCREGVRGMKVLVQAGGAAGSGWTSRRTSGVRTAG